MNRRIVAMVFGIGISSLPSSGLDAAQTTGDPWPRRVLITNDDGIDNEEIRQLALAFSRVAETYVVAPMEERSGSSTHLNLRDSLRVEPRALEKGIHAWAVDGFPADCVLVGVLGLMREAPPDLVVSGINTGPNISDQWVASGTVGAARIAASLGIPAIAASGVDRTIPGAVEAAAEWVVRLAQSSVVRDLVPPRYLTVSLPLLPPNEIMGIRVAEHDKGFFRTPTYREVEDGVWRAEFNRGEVEKSAPRDPDADVYLYESGYIVVVPMRVDEHDREALSRLKERIDSLPEWHEADPN